MINSRPLSHNITRGLMYTVVLGVILAVLLLIFCHPRWALTHLQTKDVRYFFEVHHKYLALTIDDAPSEGTQSILAVLQKYKVPATFFIIGRNAQQNPKLLARIVDDGHLLANHDIVDRRSAQADIPSLMSGVIETQTVIDAVQESHQKFFRPGGGFYHPEMVRRLSALDYTLVLGDCYPFDLIVRIPFLMARYIMHKVQPGSVIVMHDGSRTRALNTAETLDYCIPRLQKEGYRFVTLDRLYSAEKRQQ